MEWRSENRNDLRLYDGAEVLAELRYGRWSRQQVEVIIRGASFSIDRPKMLSRFYQFTSGSFGEVLATIRPKLLGPGEISYLDGSTYTYRSKGLTAKHWMVQDSNGNELISIDVHYGRSKSAEVRWSERSSRNARNIQLTAILMHMILLMKERSS